MRNPCKECIYYHKENNTCQSKKCATGGYGYVTLMDKMFCEPYKQTEERESIKNAPIIPAEEGE